MSEYELVDILLSTVIVAVSFFVAFISATSAFLAAAYLSGKNLPPFFAKLVLTL